MEYNQIIYSNTFQFNIIVVANLALSSGLLSCNSDSYL